MIETDITFVLSAPSPLSDKHVSQVNAVAAHTEGTWLLFLEHPKRQTI